MLCVRTHSRIDIRYLLYLRVDKQESQHILCCSVDSEVFSAKVMNFQSIRSILKTLGFTCTRDDVRVNKAYMAKGHIIILEPVRRNNCG
jgi:hypothetical protein